MEQNSNEKKLSLALTLQSVLHQIEELEKHDDYRRYFKQRVENFYNWLDEFNSAFTKALTPQQCDEYAKIVQIHDEISRSVYIVDESRFANLNENPDKYRIVEVLIDSALNNESRQNARLVLQSIEGRRHVVVVSKEWITNHKNRLYEAYSFADIIEIEKENKL